MAKIVIETERDVQSVTVDDQEFPIGHPIETNKEIVERIESIPGITTREAKKDDGDTVEPNPAAGAGGQQQQGEGETGHAGGEAPPTP
jgi:hypothetical protein